MYVDVCLYVYLCFSIYVLRSYSFFYLSIDGCLAVVVSELHLGPERQSNSRSGPIGHV